MSTTSFLCQPTAFATYESDPVVAETRNLFICLRAHHYARCIVSAYTKDVEVNPIGARLRHSPLR